jgi:hypothetical protein
MEDNLNDSEIKVINASEEGIEPDEKSVFGGEEDHWCRKIARLLRKRRRHIGLLRRRAAACTSHADKLEAEPEPVLSFSHEYDPIRERELDQEAMDQLEQDAYDDWDLLYRHHTYSGGMYSAYRVETPQGGFYVRRNALTKEERRRIIKELRDEAAADLINASKLDRIRLRIHRTVRKSDKSA